ncbi:hypothetical protein CASFOL_011415 [Castilleja foliolosa]|uniref:Phosphotransferase n=1 Tax=Castilleja foliolosa TaxID=1961234 RepID=A0ABD3DVF9_9LAMI
METLKEEWEVALDDLGTESAHLLEGVFYVLDLGGTNFCVLRVQLGGKERGALYCP